MGTAARLKSLQRLRAETMKKEFLIVVLLATLALSVGWLAAQTAPPAPAFILQLDPAHTGVDFDLPDVLHTVRGSFSLRRGTIQFDPATGKAGGEIVFDAPSGNTGNSSRDRKMQRDVLESPHYPEIVFRPDRAQGVLLASGVSTLQVHGVFGIHGAEHEVTIPVEVSLSGSAWKANASFPVPYVLWGMKNPSVLFLRVGDSVAIKLHAGGSVVR
jgi:polyisoprenoid-binding protein YceI